MLEEKSRTCVFCQKMSTCATPFSGNLAAPLLLLSLHATDLFCNYFIRHRPTTDHRFFLPLDFHRFFTPCTVEYSANATVMERSVASDPSPALLKDVMYLYKGTFRFVAAMIASRR